MHRLVFLVVLVVSAPAFAGDLTPKLDSWLASHTDDARWLEGGTKEKPRAFLELSKDSFIVIMKLPDGVTARKVIDTVMNYDVYRRTSDVETSYQADGAFFTGTRVMGFFSPTVTSNSYKIDGNAMRMDWKKMGDEKAEDYLEDHESEMRATLKAAGMKYDEDDVEDYIEDAVDRLDAIKSVVGSHEVRDGWYRYQQVIYLKSKWLDKASRKLGENRQFEAALKAACYNTGQFTWAGAEGKKGVTFDTRGNVGGEVTPGK